MARGPVRRERVVPGELARKIRVPDRLPVRAVDARDGEALDARAHEARAEVGAGQADLDRLERLAREDRHAVPALLAVDHRVIALRLELGARKLRVGELGLLERHDVGLARGEPVQEQRHGASGVR